LPWALLIVRNGDVIDEQENLIVNLLDQEITRSEMTA